MHAVVRRSLPALALAAALALAPPPAAAQGAAARASQFYEDALQRFDKKDYAGAVVQLKNVLKLDGRNLSAQVLLGQALLEQGQLGPAEVALNEASRLGTNRAEVAVALARVYQGLGRPRQVLDDPRLSIEGLPAATQLDLLLQRASAALDLSEPAAALAALASARTLAPADPRSHIGEVSVHLRQRDLGAARAAAEKAIALSPNDAEAQFVHGEVLHVAGDARRARAAYDRVLELLPTHVGALVARAGIALDEGRVADAGRDVEATLVQSPRELRALYLKALVAERQQRAADARAALNALTAQIDAVAIESLRYRPQLLQLGGMAHHGLGQREKAKPYLEGVMRSQPGNPVAKLLAEIHLADRNADAAVLVLTDYMRSQPRDPQAALLLANAHLNAGRGPRAVQVLQEALTSAGDLPALRSTLGLALAASGRFAEALKELEAAFNRDPRQREVGLALGSLLVQGGNGAPALRVAERLAKAHAADPGVLMLTGQARALLRDKAGARAAFEAVLRTDPKLHQARVELARLDLLDNQVAQAARQLDLVLAADDRNLPALLSIAELSERRGQLDQAERWLSRADEVAGPAQVGPALALVDLHLRHGAAGKAREALKRAQARAPDAPNTLVAGARVQLASGDPGAARTSLARAATAAGFNVPQLTQIAALQVQAGAAAAAAHSLDKALTERPNHVPALALRTEIEIRAGEFASAEKRIRQVQSLQPRAGQGWALAGQLASARRQSDVAVAAYRRAHELDRNSASLLRLFIVLQGTDRAGALKLAQKWVETNPADTLIWRTLADAQFNAGQLAEARRGYETLIKLDSRDPDVYNNYAHLLLRSNDAQALAMAERALVLGPGLPHVIGTAGWAAFKAGQPDRALQLLRDARLRDPASADTRFYLAAVLATLKRDGEARTELTAALAPGSGLSHRAEAEQLLARLR